MAALVEDPTAPGEKWYRMGGENRSNGPDRCRIVHGSRIESAQDRCAVKT